MRDRVHTHKQPMIECTDYEKKLHRSKKQLLVMIAKHGHPHGTPKQ